MVLNKVVVIFISMGVGQAFSYVLDKPGSLNEQEHTFLDRKLTYKVESYYEPLEKDENDKKQKEQIYLSPMNPILLINDFKKSKNEELYKLFKTLKAIDFPSSLFKKEEDKSQ